MNIEIPTNDYNTQSKVEELTKYILDKFADKTKMSLYVSISKYGYSVCKEVGRAFNKAGYYSYFGQSDRCKPITLWIYRTEQAPNFYRDKIV